MAALGEAWSLFSHGEGADAITVLELHLRDHPRSGLVLLGLGQLYLMAGQGRPDLMPREGPAADVGDWGRNQRRLLGRAAELLRRAVALRPDDAVPEYLLADVARAGGDLEVARRSEAAGHAKCSLPQSFELLRRYQELSRHPARLRSDILPQYPRAAVERGATGEVVADLLIDPAGRVAQVVLVEAPDPDLGRAAAAAMREASFVPARIGKYPIWSWLRIPVRFSLTTGAGETDG